MRDSILGHITPFPIGGGSISCTWNLCWLQDIIFPIRVGRRAREYDIYEVHNIIRVILEPHKNPQLFLYHS